MHEFPANSLSERARTSRFFHMRASASREILMPPLKLTNEEMTAVFQAARPIPVPP